MASAWRIYGPDGQPMVVQTPDGQIERPGAPGTQLVVPGDVERVYAAEVQKRVRSRAVTVAQVQDKERGRSKPTPVTFDTLRLMAERSEWVRAIIKTRKAQIAGVKWDIALKDTDDPSGAARKAARAIRKLLTRPMMHGSEPQSMHWQDFIALWLEDLLAIDRACIEKERDGNGWIVALYPVDGATIRPRLNDRGSFEDDAYVQVVDGQATARFGMEDLIVSIDNPQTDVRRAGYGVSPLENLVVSVTADLHAAKFNASYFEKGAVPEGLLNLGEDVDPESVDAFRLYWLNEIMGRPWSLPIIGGSKAPEFIQWRDSHRDMQFMEYQEWLLQKLCAVYQISRQELGSIEDVNRSTADSQDSSNERKGITPLLDRIKNTIDLEIIGEHGNGLGDYLEFEWEQVGESSDEINAKFQPLVASGAATRQEWRDAHALGEPDERSHGAEGLRMHLSDGSPQPLPSGKDAGVMGAAAQQDREDEQGEQQRAHEASQAEQQRQQQDGGGEASSVPWQPADGEDPATRQAMDDHDRESGIGPRNVGKTHPAGHDHSPSLTGREDDLTDEFTAATDRLVEALAGVLGE